MTYGAHLKPPNAKASPLIRVNIIRDVGNTHADYLLLEHVKQ